MTFASRSTIAIKALRQLGFTQVALNTLYKFGLASGHYRRAIQPPAPVSSLQLNPILPMPGPDALRLCLGDRGLRALLEEAGEITNGKFRQFGAESVPLQLVPDGTLAHWTAYEAGQIKPSDDIKLTWEPARFGWAFILGRAYHLSHDEQYAAAFWQFFEAFNRANPAYQGPNWTSGQEVGLRLMAWVWSAQIFNGSEHSSPARVSTLANAIAEHAARIPATLLYARSQNNNHLLTEAAALYTAALALPAHSQSGLWLKTGRRWLAWCFEHQIDAGGEYVQHSANYQRLMLQTALWVNALSTGKPGQETEFPGGKPGREKLALAAGWLTTRLDPISGWVPNLGANDGALIFPLSICEFIDYRPAAQAASRAFLSSARCAAPGLWDEMSLWFGLPLTAETSVNIRSAPGLIRAQNSWGSLRAVHYTSRPSHADQLHCELWWRGLNIAQDAGTFRYNAAPPWDNQLTSTLVHNTVSVNEQEQMTRASRFLYLDWASAAFDHPVDGTGGEPRPTQRVSARTAAYARLGVRHTRVLMLFEEERWLVEDELTYAPLPDPQKANPTYRLHWLLPDWKWELDVQPQHSTLWLNSPFGRMSLAIMASQPIKRVALLRAGELLYGAGLVSPVFGWFSPTYNVKKPALSLAVEVQSSQSIRFSTEFFFPNL